MKRWHVGVSVALVVGAVVFGGLWLHAASVESGEADRIAIGDYPVRGAHLAGDVLVVPEADGVRTAVVYSLESDSELASYDTYQVYVADGPIIAVLQTRGAATALGEDGDVAWSTETVTETERYASFWPDSVSEDGTVVMRACLEADVDHSEYDILGVDSSGELSWQSEASGDFLFQPARSSSALGANDSVPLAQQTVDVAYQSDSEPGFANIFDPEAGKTATIPDSPRINFHGIRSIGLTQPVPDEFYADTDDELCELTLRDRDDPEVATVAHTCRMLYYGYPTGDYVSFGHWRQDWLETADDPSDESGLLHAPTGQWVSSVSPSGVADQFILSAAGLAERLGETWYLSGIDESGAEVQHQLPAGYAPVAFSPETLVVGKDLNSWNPLVSGDLREFVIVETATGDPCAVTRATGISDPVALAGCQALVRDSDGMASLVGRD